MNEIRIENYPGGGGDGSHSSGFDINLKFWQFVKQYLSSPLIPSSEGGGGDGDDDGGINQLIMDMSMSTSRWATIGGEGGANNEKKQSFCQDCEDLVSSVCAVHKQLVTAQLHLDWKLGEVGRLLKVSKEKVSSKLGKMLMKSLAEQMGLNKKHKVNRVDKVRSWLMEKCMKKILQNIIN
ncbi:unnamed protein product [Orchesella dallaii]|uniref:Uncharacterized protein n=1 Tax=Orchesella dallaii TaxID=48710 RepID=A0ABP1R7F1_9HEXA